MLGIASNAGAVSVIAELKIGCEKTVQRRNPSEFGKFARGKAKFARGKAMRGFGTPAWEDHTANEPSRVEGYTPERRAEFLLNNAVDQADFAAATREVRAMGVDTKQIEHIRIGNSKPPGE